MDRIPLVRTSLQSASHVATMRNPYVMNAVQAGGWCAASATAPQTFAKFGKSTACKSHGEGGGCANQVYVIKGNAKLGVNCSLPGVNLIKCSLLVIKR